MKKKLTKIWGIGMIVVLLSSLLIVGATPASAATLAYSALPIPGGTLNQVAAGTDVALVRVAPNGDLFATVRPDGSLTVWDVESGKQKATIRSEGILSCQGRYTADGKYLLLQTNVAIDVGQRRVRVETWEIDAEQPGLVVASESVAISKNGSRIAYELEERTSIVDSIEYCVC